MWISLCSGRVGVRYEDCILVLCIRNPSNCCEQRLEGFHVTDPKNKKTQTTCKHAVEVSIPGVSTELDTKNVKMIAV